MRIRGFTLLELIIVIIVIGILASLGLTQYTKVVEKARTAEARIILGQIRTAQEAYNQEFAANTTNIARLIVSAPTACIATHYFSYSTDTNTVTATRCSSDGKAPQGAVAYTVTLTLSTGVWGGSAGYY